jgi:release factor glutamine methyltransferase
MTGNARRTPRRIARPCATPLLGATSDTARLDAEVLMAHALGLSRSDLLLRHMRDAAPKPPSPRWSNGALAHEPVAYILGRQEFFGLDFASRPMC